MSTVSRTVVLVLVMSLIPASLVAEELEQRVMIGVGGGGASRAWALTGEVYAFPSEWLGVLAGVSYGGTTHERSTFSVSGDAIFKQEINTLTVDGLIGLRRPLMGRGFVFLGAGVSYQNVDGDINDPGPLVERVVEYEPGWGTVFAATMAAPVGSRWFGFLSLKRRYLSSEYTELVTTGLNPPQTYSVTYKSSTGGIEMTVGIGFGF